MHTGFHYFSLDNYVDSPHNPAIYLRFYRSSFYLFCYLPGRGDATAPARVWFEHRFIDDVPPRSRHQHPAYAGVGGGDVRYRLLCRQT